jgi:hypothetical protein
MLMRYALFWGITQRRMVIFTDVSAQRIGPIFKGQEFQEEKKYYNLALLNNPEERWSEQASLL